MSDKTSDTISRQTAIDKADSLYRDTKNDECYMITGYNHAISDIRAILKSLPSAQPDSKETSSTHKALDTVSRQAAIDACTKSKVGAFPHDAGVNNSIEAIKVLPSAEPEPVVRCKNCKYYGYNECLHDLGLVKAQDNNFCSYAERRTDEYDKQTN